MNKRKKGSRARGTWTHGFGEKKKHRGAGSRGGRGMAGTGKRGDVKKPSIAANKKYFGKHGFKQGLRVEVPTINVSLLTQKMDGFVAQKIAVKSGDSYKVELPTYKLLGSGVIETAVEITVKSASAKAIEKIEAAGGKVILPVVQKAVEEPKAEPKTEE